MGDERITKTEANWRKLFDEHQILSHVEQDGYFEITAAQINRYREARLMAKFDHSNGLPPLFKKHGLAILPVSRSKYIIGRFDAYHVLPSVDESPIIVVDFPGGIQSLAPESIYSESAALNCAFLCGMIDDVLSEKAVPTVSGKMSTSPFDFEIRTSATSKATVSVTNSQCEIDAGYESANKLVLVEAKNVAPADFIVRQVYYPFRLWNTKVSKEVVPVYMTLSNDVFAFFVYRFETVSDYNSLVLVESKRYRITSERITRDEIVHVVRSARIVEEPKVPFPQADSFERLVDLLGLLMVEDLSPDDITTNYGFDERQTDYYTNAGRYLGLVEKLKNDSEIAFSISALGRAIMSMPPKKKNLAMAEEILKHETFNIAVKLSLGRHALINKEDAVRVMKDARIRNVAEESTFIRRAQTVVSWVRWILSLSQN